jgi:hypothetical protein
MKISATRFAIAPICAPPVTAPREPTSAPPPPVCFSLWALLTRQ